MNRADRRKYAKTINSPQKLDEFGTKLERYLKAEYEKIYDRKVTRFIETYTVLTAYVLNYKLGLGRKRLPKIINEIMRHVDMVDEGYITIDDCRDELKRVGIEIRFRAEEVSNNDNN